MKTKNLCDFKTKIELQIEMKLTQVVEKLLTFFVACVRSDKTSTMVLEVKLFIWR